VIDKKVYYIAMAAVGVLIIGLTVQGCDLQKMIKFDVPSGVQGAIDANETETLANSDYIWSQWENWVQANSEALASNISDANARVALINDVTALGMGALGEVSNTFPGGAVLFSGLSLLAGWFLKRPGEDKVVAKEKEDSYNAGLAKGQELAQKIKEEINA
jgi:hypothetical protein